MSKKRFSLGEQLKYSWFNIVLSFITMIVVIFVASIARSDRDIVECRAALMNNLHEQLGDSLGPNGETDEWNVLFDEWHHKLETYQSGGTVPDIPECRR